MASSRASIALAGLILLAAVAIGWWAIGTSSGHASPTRSKHHPEDQTAREGNEKSVSSQAVTEVVRELMEPRAVAVVKKLPAGTGVPTEFRTHGQLPAGLLTQEQRDLRRNIVSLQQQLAEEASKDDPDIVDQARIVRRLETRIAQLKMMEDGEYLLLDHGAWRSIWKTNPEGYRVIMTDTVSIDERRVDIVQVVEIAKHEGLRQAMDYVDESEGGRGIQAAFEFNSRSDEVRFACVRAYESGATGTHPHDVFLLRTALSFGHRLDKSRALAVK